MFLEILLPVQAFTTVFSPASRVVLSYTVCKEADSLGKTFPDFRAFLSVCQCVGLLLHEGELRRNSY